LLVAVKETQGGSRRLKPETGQIVY